MKKVINITIGSIVFPIEEDAYEKLRRYLNDVQKHFSKTGEAEEIIEDIETGIAEKLIKEYGNANRSVSLKTIEKIIDQIGTVKDFEQESTDEPTSPSDSQKLYRNPDNKIIGGVCSGIATYFNIDPTIVRIIFALAAIPGGSGIIIYAILWLIVPEAKTTTEKLEMRGESLTLATIEDSLKKGVENIKKKKLPKTNKIKHFFERIFSLLGTFIKNIFPLIGKILGLGLTTIGIVGIFTLGIGTVVMLKTTEIFSDILAFEITKNVFTSWEYYFLGAMAYLIIAIPLLFIVILGLSLYRSKNRFKLSTIIILLMFWSAAITSAAVTTIDKIPDIQKQVTNTRTNVPHPPQRP